MKLLLCALALAPRGEGHGNMQLPHAWWDPLGMVGATPGSQCTVGCSGRTPPGAVEPMTEHCGCEWYTNHTFIPGEATIPRASPLRTYQDWNFGSGPVDWTAKMPWRAPGTAPILSPCGVDGGNLQGCPAGNPSPHGCAGGGYGHGPDAREFYPKFLHPRTTEWTAGSVVEAAWAITANHGGGYSYRLCKRPERMTDLSEECFQRTVLDFAGEEQWVQYGFGRRTAFPAMRTKEGTFPKGSHWTRNPIPACMGPGGGSCAGSHLQCGTGPWGNETAGSGVQFPPPFAYGYGFGTNDPSLPGGKAGGKFHWSIVDRLQVPKDLAPGDYVLSFRWDCEQTSQVWNTCANVRVTEEKSSLVV